MKEKKLNRVNEFSANFLLTEYNRISKLDLDNRSQGETKFNIYLTLVSIFIACLITIWEATDKSLLNEIHNFFLILLLISIFLLFIGWNIFILYVSRWRLNVIYLRKLARIRKWFLDLDSNLENGLTYGIDETKPSFISKRMFFSSFITFVVIFNCSFASVTFFSVIKLIEIEYSRNYLILNICIFLFVFFVHYFVFIKKAIKFEKDTHVAFPDIKKESD